MLLDLTKMQFMVAFLLVTIRGNLDDKFLLSICKQIPGNNVHALGIQLGISDADIQNIKSSDQHVAGNWAYQVLNLWKQRREKHENIQRLLAEALREIGRVDLAHQVLEYKRSKKVGSSSKYSDEQVGEDERSHTEESNDRRKTAETTDFSLPGGIMIALTLVILSIVACACRKVRVPDCTKTFNKMAGMSAPIKWELMFHDISLTEGEFKKLGKKFGFDEGRLSNMQSSCKHDAEAWSPAMLTKWWQRQDGDDATIWKKLVDGLEYIERFDIVRDLRKNHKITY
ncbi:unnamed protein product [Owenia fusiformis]|uniref:Uncharacterized protein n=1 Tax=Owenia fusiformis TaxID=6347 RepID=A0A8J1T597_OWEFU|nr:unnamed protein product [Owenia fusiformis]